MKAIVAISENMGIGMKNDLPWPKVSEDFKFFKKQTMNHGIIVGRKTFDTLPKLNGRHVKVFTRQIELLSNSKFEGGEYFNLAAFFGKSEFLKWSENDYVCGGAEIYKMFIPFCDEIYITHIKGSYECDTYFPFSMDEIEKMFPKNEIISEIEGGHVIKRYLK